MTFEQAYAYIVTVMVLALANRPPRQEGPDAKGRVLQLGREALKVPNRRFTAIPLTAEPYISEDQMYSEYRAPRTSVLAVYERDGNEGVAVLQRRPTSARHAGQDREDAKIVTVVPYRHGEGAHASIAFDFDREVSVLPGARSLSLDTLAPQQVNEHAGANIWLDPENSDGPAGLRQPVVVIDPGTAPGPKEVWAREKFPID